MLQERDSECVNFSHHFTLKHYPDSGQKRGLKSPLKMSDNARYRSFLNSLNSVSLAGSFRSPAGQGFV